MPLVSIDGVCLEAPKIFLILGNQDVNEEQDEIMNKK